MSSTKILIALIVSIVTLCGAFIQITEIAATGHEHFYEKHYAKKGFTYKQFRKAVVSLWLLELISFVSTVFFSVAYIQLYIKF